MKRKKQDGAGIIITKVCFAFEQAGKLTATGDKVETCIQPPDDGRVIIFDFSN